MIGLRFLPVVLRQVVRHPTRSILTVLGIATAMFLFTTIESIQAGTRAATEASGREATLVVFRENRFCPFTSRLPDHYQRRIESIDGVDEVLPMRIVVSNCRTSLDVVTFRGVPAESAAPALGRRLEFVAGSLSEWQARSDAALVGLVLAERRGLSVGDRFDANGLTVQVAGIIDSPEPQDRDVAYVHLSFLQLAGHGQFQGIVTQFNVTVSDPERLDEIARRIDAEFADDQEPTTTSSEKAFVSRAAGDLMALIAFTRWVALGSLLAVLGLVANTIVLSVRDRVRDLAVLATLGYRGHLIARLIVAEGVVLSLAGGLAGGAGALVFLDRGAYSLANEGLSIHFPADPALLATSLAAAALLGVVASLVPALVAGSRPIVESFRAV